MELLRNNRQLCSMLPDLALHEKRSFPLRISSVNVTKSLMGNFIFCAFSLPPIIIIIIGNANPHLFTLVISQTLYFFFKKSTAPKKP